MAEIGLIAGLTVMFIPFAVTASLLGATRAHLANREIQEISRIKEGIDKVIRVEEQRQQLEAEVKRQKIVQNLNNMIGINCYGTPYSEYGILHILKQNLNFDVSYIYDNDKTLLDIAIDLSSIESFNKILDISNIPLETLLHSINYLNETIVRLPKNKTRPQMKIILEDKLRELGINI
jgi:hypothetical protein